MKRFQIMVFLLFCVTLIGAQGQVGHEKLLLQKQY
jgi:hypothetical protein